MFQIAVPVFVFLYSLLRRWDVWIARHIQLIALKYSNCTGRWRISTKIAVVSLLYVGINIGLMLPQVSRLPIHQSSSFLAVLNITPLFLSGRTNPLVDILQIPAATFLFFSYCVAALGTVQVVIHAWNTPQGTTHFTTGVIALGCVLATILGNAISLTAETFGRRTCSVQIRRVLSMVCWPLPLLITIATVWHFMQVSLGQLWPSLTLSLLGGLLWLTTQLIWIYNYLHHGRAFATIEGQGGRVLNIQLKKPIKARPGYFYIKGSSLSPAMQNQPIPMLWWQPNATTIQHFAVLADQESSTTSAGRSQVKLDGPYQEQLHLGKYEVVIFVAQGPDIGRVLSHLLHLTTRMMQDKDAKQPESRWYLDGLFNDKTRKIDLYWKMDRNDDISHFNTYFKELSDCGADSKLQAWIHYPDGVPQDTQLPTSRGKQHWFPTDGDFLRQVSSAIEVQSKRTPGRTVVVSEYVTT